jgi:ribosome biogenesis protein ERB1
LPLFASASDDGTIHIFHATVHTDFNSNVTIVPLKVLKSHKIVEGLGILDVKWHPEQPWLVSAGADGEVKMFCS